MKSLFLCLLVLILFSDSVSGQVDKHIYYIIKKSEIEKGNINLIYRDTTGNIKPLRMCYSQLKAEDLSLKDEIVTFHFEKIPSSKYDTVPDCISNRTPMGSFTINLQKDSIGDEYKIINLPFKTRGFGISLIPYRIRFPSDSIPLTTDSKLDLSLTYGFSFGNARINHERITHKYVTLGFFMGITSVSLDKKSVSNPGLLKIERDAVAISYGVNATFGINDLGLSLSFGIDTALGDNASLWIYQNKPWFGIGISTKFNLL